MSKNFELARGAVGDKLIYVQPQADGPELRFRAEITAKNKNWLTLAWWNSRGVQLSLRHNCNTGFTYMLWRVKRIDPAPYFMEIEDGN